MHHHVPRCATHAAAPAAWSCAQCGKGLCPNCAAEVAVGGGRNVRCVHCGGLGEPVRVPKAIRPYWEMFPRFFAAIFTAQGLTQVLALAVFMYVFGFAPLIGPLVVAGIWAAYYFHVINSAADGEEDLPMPGDFDGWSSGVFRPLGRMIVAYAIIWVPVVLYITLDIGLRNFLLDPVSGILDPVLLFFLILGILYFPGAVILVAISESALVALNPVAVIGLLVRYPGQYLLLTAIWLGMSFLSLLWGVMLGVLGRLLPVPVLVPLLIQALSLIIPLLTAKMLGWFIYQNAEELGYAQVGSQMVVAFPDAKPLARWDELRREAVEPEAPEPPAPTAPVPPQPGAPGAIHLSPNDLVGDAETPTVDSLRTDLHIGDVDSAAAAYQALQEAGAPVPPDLEYEVGEILARKGDWHTAVKAFHQAAKSDMAGPQAAPGLYRAGELLATRLDHPEGAAPLLRHVADFFPHDPHAARARALLARLSS